MTMPLKKYSERLKKKAQSESRVLSIVSLGGRKNKSNFCFVVEYYSLNKLL